MKTLTTLLLLTILSFGALAQSDEKQISHQQQYWIRYYNKLSLSDNWTIKTEIEHRRFAFPDRKLQWFLPRIDLVRKFGKGWDFGIGFTYVPQYQPSDPEKSVEFVRREFRPHQRLTYKHGSKLVFSHRYALEERFIRKTSSEGEIDGYNFNFRARYRLQLAYPLIEAEGGKGLKAKASGELLLNFGEHIVNNTFDQGRVYLGLEYSLSKKIQLEVGYFKILQQKSSGNQYLNSDVARLTLSHSIDLTK